MQHNNAWVAPIVFALAFCESFAFVSLFVPATLILFGIGGMVGLSGIEYWSIWISAAIGSHTTGHPVQRQVLRVWALSRHPEVVARGFAFFERWGIAAVFVGRFLGPLRAIVPVAAGVCGMSWMRFQIANATSAIVWTGGILAPGIFGAALVERRLGRKRGRWRVRPRPATRSHDVRTAARACSCRPRAASAMMRRRRT
jgi:membrane protein DedA with SNARE-associated domain